VLHGRGRVPAHAAEQHRAAKGLDISEAFLTFAQAQFGRGFAFLGLALALSLYLQVFRAFGDRLAAAGLAVGFVAVVIVAWWVVPARRLREHADQPGQGKRSKARPARGAKGGAQAR
jgi:hypothetical protein